MFGSTRDKAKGKRIHKAMVRRAKGTFSSFTQSCFFVCFLSLFFVVISSIFVNFKLHEICAMRKAPGTSGLKLNLLRWLVCSAVVLNLKVQVAHLYKNITMVIFKPI